MKQTKLNLFKPTGLCLAKKVVFDIEAITNNVTLLNKNQNDLKVTNVLSESICDEILDKLKKKYQFDDAEVYIAITIILQRGGTNKNGGNTVKVTLHNKNLTAQDLQNTINNIKKNATNRQFARTLANEIAQVALQLNIEGDLANQMRFEFPDLTQEEAVWCSNFQTINPQCPERVRDWLVQNYKYRFQK
jgi:sulfatase maturation enzyme AslB (radical SAM superfamily)